MNDSTFLHYKVVALVAAFLVVGALQGIAPYHDARREVLRNWRFNLPLALVNAALLGALCGGCVCSAALLAAQYRIGLLHHAAIPPSVRVLASVVILDLVAWGWHRVNHAVPLLWRFHQLHHSDVVFEASTALRFHPGELLFSLFVRLVVVVALGLPVAGILAFEIVFGIANVFVHGNVRLPRPFERVLELGLVTPAQHRRHHAARATSTNFGTVLSAWDRLGRTYELSRSDDAVRIGLESAAVDRRCCRTSG